MWVYWCLMELAATASPRRANHSFLFISLLLVCRDALVALTVRKLLISIYSCHITMVEWQFRDNSRVIQAWSAPKAPNTRLGNKDKHHKIQRRLHLSPAWYVTKERSSVIEKTHAPIAKRLASSAFTVLHHHLAVVNECTARMETRSKPKENRAGRKMVLFFNLILITKISHLFPVSKANRRGREWDLEGW